LQPGPYGTGIDHENPVLSEDEDFWAALTGHRIPTPDDVNIEKMWDSYDMKIVVLPYPIASMVRIHAARGAAGKGREGD
jgi:hypothetical protein